MNFFVIPRKQTYTSVEKSDFNELVRKKKLISEGMFLSFLLQFIPKYLANETLHNFLLIHANISNFWVKTLFLKEGKTFKKGTKFLSETQTF